MDRASDEDLIAAGLLDGVEEPEARAARLELLHGLLAHGSTLEELRRAVAEDRLALLPVERVLAEEGVRYSVRDLAEAAGLPLDFGLELYQALGFPIADPDEPRFTEIDREGAVAVAALGSVGLSRAAIVDTARVLGESMARVAAAFRSLVGEGLRRPGDTERDLGLRYADAARQLIPGTAPILQGVLALHLRELIRHEVVHQAEVASGRLPGGRRVAICFADLVGFTRASEELEPEEIGSLATRLHALATRVVRPPARLVKTIGDAAMLVSPDPEPLVATALDLVGGTEEARLPPLRAGVALGEALERGGDWYGRPVNLASRLASLARPDTVVVDEAVHDVLGDTGYPTSRLPRRHVKGIAEPLRLYRVRPAGSAPPSDG